MDSFMWFSDQDSPEREKHHVKIAWLNSSWHPLESGIQGRRENDASSISMDPRRSLSRFVKRPPIDWRPCYSR